MRKLNFFVVVAIFLVSGFSAFAQSTEKQSVDVLFLHDVHSFLDRTAQAKTLVDEQMAKNPDTLFVDGGDFSQGTLYQTVFETQAAELRTLGALGVDATTIGNHEFDRGAQGLAAMFDSARLSGDRLPEFLLCNVDWTKDDEYTQIIKKAYDEFGAKDYAVFNKGGVKIAVFGLFGKDALFCAPTCKLTFLDQYEASARVVAKIKAEEKPDMIVCISHCGTTKNPKTNEDVILAGKVPDIDLIISGHSHTKIEKPIDVGNCHVVSASAYSEYLGKINMQRNDKGRWDIKNYELLPITKDIPENQEIRAKLDQFNKDVDKEYLSKFGMESKTVLGNADYDFSRTETGYAIGKMYRIAVENFEAPGKNPENTGYGKPVDMAVVPIGMIRDEFKQGPITAQDVFTAFSLGIGPDRITGYPLVSVYMYGKELKSACEIDCSMGPMMDMLIMFFDNITYEYNPKRFPLDKVTNLYLQNEDGSKTLIEDEKLYRVVTDSYTGNMLGSVLKMTKGLIKMVPRNADGSPIENLEDNIIMTDCFPGCKEFKAWSAIAKGLELKGNFGDFRDAEKNAKIENKKASLIAKPSGAAFIIYTLIEVVCAIIVLVILLVVIKHSKKKKQK